MSLTRAMNRAVKLISKRYTEIGYVVEVTESANWRRVSVSALETVVEISYTPMRVTVTRSGKPDAQTSRELQFLLDNNI